MLTRQEFRLMEKLVGAIENLTEELTTMNKPTVVHKDVTQSSFHQRQVPALQRQTDAIDYIDMRLKGLAQPDVQIISADRGTVILETIKNTLLGLK
jgi:hypothetical protein